MTDIEAYTQARGLEKTQDPEVEKPLYRKPGFDGIETFGEMDHKLAAFVRAKREVAGLLRNDFAPLVGLSAQVYGRYERAESKLHVTRMIQLCELLGFMPIELLYEAAPHLWGSTKEEAEDRLALAKLVMKLPHRTARDLLRIVEHLQDKAEDAGSETQE